VFSRFDDQTKPPNVTAWGPSAVDVIFNATAQPKEVLASNSRVAGRSLMPQAPLAGIGADDWPVQVNGFNPGTAVLTAVNEKGAPILVGLELDLKRADALMAKRPSGIFLTRTDILKIGMVR
jgi:hypothetical protein